MSQNGGDAPKASSPGRPRHHIRRSISEISSPTRLHRRQSHRVTAAGEADRDLRALLPAPQSAIPIVHGSRSFEWSKSEGVTPNFTPSVSRRTSVLYASADEAMQVFKAPRYNKAADGLLTLERQRAAARASGLQRSLTSLETVAGTTTKQLDDTYYSVLSKLNILQSTVTQLASLAASAQQLTTSFTTETDELLVDTTSQLDTFGDFTEQQQRIEALRDRISAGRGKIRALSERVDAVSERVEGWQLADREWQERTRKRLKVVWIVTSVVVFLVLGVFVGSQYATTGDGVVTTTATRGKKVGLGVGGDSGSTCAKDLEGRG
ncbi:hypothetical protein N0V88_003995 [Collariella sp. IMI 366227]|nr:hypothetical protein N0V88_003995 [Collariella sp. IMI 366227]